MKSRFTFKFASKTHSWEAPLKPMSCIVCGSQSDITQPYCLWHLETEAQLQIKPGKFGLSLYACRNFKENEQIIEYLGEKINATEMNKRYGIKDTAPYAFQVDQKTWIDAALRRSAASLSNTSLDENKINAEIIISKDKKVFITANKDIQKGQEILTNYGEEYILENNYSNEPKQWYSTMKSGCNEKQGPWIISPQFLSFLQE